ncbi:MAG: histone deacetylase [Bacteroidia bacterium]|nr:histone deacetylase [Bacteroidia bacterium]
MLKIAWSPLFKHPLPENHRFPMEKYELIPEQLLYEGTIEEENLYRPEAMKEELILLTHTEEYWGKLCRGELSPKEIRKTGFPYSLQLLERGRVIAQGTLDNVGYAEEYGVAINGAGGTHHAYTDHGEGFCILNDIAIASTCVLNENRYRKILIIDLDVHQGNGTAEIFREESRVFTFSMHCEANYPLKKEISDLDISLAAYSGDETYLGILKETLANLLEEEKPELVFYLAGVDVLGSDKLGKLNMTKAGCKERDRFVMQSCHEKGLPLVISLGGGYSPDIRDIVDAHCNTFRLAKDIWF